MKSNVKAFFITGAITFVVSASATTILHSRQVRYKNDKSVEQAINELYEKEDECYDEDGIPLTYTKLEYLESTGTQYIDLDYYIKTNTRYEMQLLPTLTNKNVVQVYLGVNDSSGNYWMGKGSSLNYNIHLYYKKDKYIAYNSETYPILKTINVNRNNMTIGEQTVSTNEITTNFTSSAYLFAENVQESALMLSLFKLYYLQMYEGNKLVRDYVPVLDTSKRPCLYDKVDKKCYYNQGTGEFLYG